MTATPAASTLALGGEPEWVTLREAAELGEVSVSALRKAYRAGRIDSRLDAGPYGDQRLVRLDQVRAVVGARTPAAPAPTLLPQLLEEVTRGWAVASALHEAGQELGVLRERAGRAEAEAETLRGVVADLRARLDRAEDQLTRARQTTPAGVPLVVEVPVDSPVEGPPPVRRGRFGLRRHTA